MVTMQFLVRAWPWWGEWLRDILGYDLQVVENGLRVLSPLPTEVFDKVQRMEVRLVVSETRYSPVRTLAQIPCSVSICWSRPDVVGPYPYEFTTRLMYPGPARYSKQGRTCPSLGQCFQLGPF